MELNIDKRKLEINSKNNLNLGFWDLCFWQNNPIQVNKEAEVGDRLRAYIDMELKNLYSLAQAPNLFAISSQNNPELDRYFNSEIDALIARGQAQDAEYYQQNSEQLKQQLAQTFGEKQYEEYKHLVDFFAGSNYPASFQWLLLNETLQSTYRMDFSKSEPKLIVNARKPNQTILGMMNLPTEVVEYIYNNAPNYTSFKKLYIDSQVEFQKVIARNSGISFENVNTFGKGQWIKFDSQKNAPQDFEQNVANLKALVADTPWCTSTLASTHLSQGDFYVFVDNEGKAHIAVKMNGDAIDEVKGIKNGNAQELEDDYRDVAVNFLENNQEIKNGKEWLDKEEWNQRLIDYKHKILNGNFEASEIETLLQDLNHQDYKAHFNQNNNLAELKRVLPNITPLLAQYFGCTEDEMCAGNYFPIKNKEICPYAVILGNANFSDSRIKDLSNLQYIGGNADFSDSQVSDLGNLQSIGGYAYFNNSQVTSLGNLQYIGGNAYFNNSQVTDLGNLQSIGGYVSFEGSQITSLGNLQHIGGDADFMYSQITSLGNLQYIGGYVSFGGSQVTDLGNLQSIGGKADFRDSQVTSLGNLQYIGGNANFWNSQVRDLGNLQSIGGFANFGYSQVTSLDNLQHIGGKADFSDSQVSDLGNLKEIGDEAVLFDSKLKSTAKLKTIKGSAYVKKGQVIDVSSLGEVGGGVSIVDAKNIYNIEKTVPLAEYKDYMSAQIAQQSLEKKPSF